MRDDDSNRKAQKPIWVEKFTTSLQVQGFVRWDSCTWIKPEDIPVFVAKGKITRSEDVAAY